ncbi:TPR domain-containing protein [Colletotrichum melonis]|uniref:TPR domain-containing protein n=1 Tax=Colletotrichum melonis TaxID=1209925 RepID=A0AAI9V3Z6_9PEZI|nr:TPR domain-containing protein [Colletotrichum melonis]KAK1715817.1 TPR domain-containing protein [Colletotrichum lupini]
MAVSRIAACRAINGLGLRQIARSPGTSTAALRASTPRNASNVCSHTQLRHQSTSNPSYNGSKRNNASSPPPPPPPPPPSASQLLRAISFRSLLTSLTPRGIKRMFRESPEELVLALAILAGLAGVSIYIVKLYFDYFMARQFTKYPKPIAKSLRRALYYTNISPDPNLARKYYKQALEQCNELQLDPFSDDVLGIRIQTAAWLEKIGNYQGAITVLDSVLRDCLKWVEWMENSVADGTVEKSGKPPAAKPLLENQRLAVPENGEEKVVENLWHKRTRLLAKAVGTSTKLGALYSDEHVLEPENSLARLTWAVETALAESKRRHKEGVKKDEGSWMSPEEIGGAMESLAQHYETKSQFHLAVPLLFQALRLCASPCHRVTIMNNLAAAFAQHPLQTPLDAIPNAPATSDAIVSPDMPTDRAGLLEAAKNWASNAYSHSKDVKGEDRTEECDEACAVALTNMGDIAALLGKKEDARKRFQQAIDMSRKIGFGPGISQAEAGLQKL